MGDYDINVFDYEAHCSTAEFADLMWSHSFMPLSIATYQLYV